MLPVVERFLSFAQLAKGRSAVSLCEEAAKDTSLFVFGEILSHRNIRALKGTEFEGALLLLETIAFDSWRKYRHLIEEGRIKDLGEKVEEKVKILSVVSMAYKEKNIPYGALQSLFALPDILSVESLVIQCIVHGLLTARLDHRRCIVRVTSVSGRDVRLPFHLTYRSSPRIKSRSGTALESSSWQSNRNGDTQATAGNRNRQHSENCGNDANGSGNGDDDGCANGSGNGDDDECDVDSDPKGLAVRLRRALLRVEGAVEALGESAKGAAESARKDRESERKTAAELDARVMVMDAEGNELADERRTKRAR